MNQLTELQIHTLVITFVAIVIAGLLILKKQMKDE